MTYLRRIKYLLVALFVFGTFIVGADQQWASATVSTSYQIVSQRTPSGTYTDTKPALIRSPHSISGNGRYAVFSSEATNIVSNDTNGVSDIFVRDTVNNTTSRVNISSTGSQSDATSDNASISNDGRYVVFESYADNLASGITGTGTSHIYIRDTVSNTTSIVDTSSSGVINNRAAYGPRVSANGRFVVFATDSSNLVTGISSIGTQQVYVKDTHSGAIKILSVTSTGVKGSSDSVLPDINCSGNIVTFATVATNLGGLGTSGRYDLAIAEIGWNSVELNTVTSGQNGGINADYYGSPQISCNGNIALYSSSSTDAVSPSTPSGYNNAYEYNRLTGANVQVSLGNGSAQASSAQLGKPVYASMSDDGRYVAFSNYATNIDTTYPSGTDTGSNSNIYIRDVAKSTTSLATILPTGDRSGWAASTLSISSDGGSLAFSHLTPHTPFPERSLITGFSTGSTTNSSTDIYWTQTGF